MFTVKFDASQFLKGLDKMEKDLDSFVDNSLHEMADTLLLLSRAEVPHDEGVLQGSGNVAKQGKDWIVSYNTPYALYQHEGVRADGTHRIVNYQKGRKGKYLEDPLKLNLSRWQGIFAKEMSKLIK